MRRFELNAASILLLAGAFGGCWNGTMKPGSACASCHDGGDASRFGVAGTIYARVAAGEDDGLEGILVDLKDSKGRMVSLASNEVGNFYTEAQLTPPLEVTLGRPGAATVSTLAPSGDCNSCHAGGSSLGRVHIP